MKWRDVIRGALSWPCPLAAACVARCQGLPAASAPVTPLPAAEAARPPCALWKLRRHFRPLRRHFRSQVPYFSSPRNPIQTARSAATRPLEGLETHCPPQPCRVLRTMMTHLHPFHLSQPSRRSSGLRSCRAELGSGGPCSHGAWAWWGKAPRGHFRRECPSASVGRAV